MHSQRKPYTFINIESLVTMVLLSLCAKVDENELKELDELVCWDPGVVSCFSRNYFVRDKVKVIFTSHLVQSSEGLLS